MGAKAPTSRRPPTISRRATASSPEITTITTAAARPPSPSLPPHGRASPPSRSSDLAPFGASSAARGPDLDSWGASRERPRGHFPRGRLIWSRLGDLLATVHVRPQHIGDSHRAVGVLVVLQDRNEDSRAGDDGVVEGVAEFQFTVGRLVAQVQP